LTTITRISRRFSQKSVLHAQLAHFLLQRLQFRPLRNCQLLRIIAMTLAVGRHPIPKGLLHQAKLTRNIGVGRDCR